MRGSLSFVRSLLLVCERGVSDGKKALVLEQSLLQVGGKRGNVMEALLEGCCDVMSWSFA